MENKGPGHISENELDDLLNEAFLDLALENKSVIGQSLDVIANHVMSRNLLLNFITAYRLDRLLLLFSAAICLSSLYTFLSTSSVPLGPVNKGGVPVVAVNALSGTEVKDHKRFDLREIEPVLEKPSPALKKVSKNQAVNKKAEKNAQDAGAGLITLETVVDSTSDLTGPNSEDQGAEKATKNTSVDSSAYAPDKMIISPTERPRTKITPSKEGTTLKSKKGKKEIRRGRKVFRRGGMFIMQGNKYRKSTRH